MFPTLQGTVKELCNYKVLKMCQNLHANMEGFRGASHIFEWCDGIRSAFA